MTVKLTPTRTRKMLTEKLNNFKEAVPKSVRKLQLLNFDPIAELVKKHNILSDEIERQQKIRDGVIIEYRQDGKPKAYDKNFHMALYDKQIAISDKLLRYGYGRVPETIEVQSERGLPITINLTGQQSDD